MSEQPTQVHGVVGEQCANCSAPLAADQRYCLNCGTRRAERRVPVEATGRLGGSVVTTTTTALAEPPALAPAQRLGGAWGVAALILLALGIGVLIGFAGGEDPAPLGSAPPPVTIAAPATGPTAAAATVATGAVVADEWPDRDGFTVQLGELPAATDQAAADAAKAAASAKGAPEPGVLDAGAHGLTEGILVLYSGVFSKRAQATKALAELKDAYPDARVIEVQATSSSSSAAAGGEDATESAAADDAGSAPATVSKEALAAQEKLSGDQAVEQSKKLPKTTALPGKAPEKDNAAPGGGSEAETIG